MPEDRTSIYHKYRLRLEPEKLGLPVTGTAFRDKVQKALQAEDVDAVLWQRTSIPEQPLFQILEGYGKGCPWTCEKLGDVRYSYDAADYPETMRMLANSLVVCSETYPIYCQPIGVMERYVEALQKVFANLDQVMRVESEDLGEQVGGTVVKS